MLTGNVIKTTTIGTFDLSLVTRKNAFSSGVVQYSIVSGIVIGDGENELGVGAGCNIGGHLDLDGSFNFERHRKWHPSTCKLHPLSGPQPCTRFAVEGSEPLF